MIQAKPSQANQKAKTRRRNSKYQGMKVRRDLSLGHYLEEKLEDDWSPEAISGRIREIDKQIQYISPKGIYKFIDSVYGQFFEKHLAYKEKRKNKRKYTKITQLQDRTFIDKRPKIVEKRRRFGDWEGDFIVSSKNGKGVLLVLYERKSRYILLKKIVDCKMEIVYQLIFELTGNIIMNTLTLDNDIIFKKHKELSEILGLPLYFCHPYHFWEKGGVENSNKLIRRYIPKSSDISRYSDQFIKTVEDKLNNRPRKCLGYKTPKEIMVENQQLKYTIDDILKTDFNYSNYSKNKKSQVLHLRG